MKKTDLVLIASVIFLTIFGLFMIYDASSFVAFRDFSDKYHFVKDQIFWVFLGITSLIFFANFDYHRLYNLAIPALLASIALLFMVFIPGLGLKLLGASRWVDFKFFTLQPSEVVKLTLAIYLSAWFSNKEKGRLRAFLLLVGLILSLVVMQPDMGTSIIILAEAVTVYFLSGANILHLLILAPITFIIGTIVAIIEPYRLQRIYTFFNSNQDIANSSYHVRQILIALGSGGLIGVGLGNSLQKYAYLPENATDSIFAIIAEELGFIGALAIILIFVTVIIRGFRISAMAKDLFGKLLSGGICAFLATQIILNLGSQTALIPLTGVPLPFISHGGTSLIINLTSIGILLNIKKQST
ncbi:MAG: cell division protein FtsW [Candidatus Levybacteria bacterium RIFCSPHIGHO2_01_FULL_37_17]|nr:MAG: cell division protein FtsW [Candidatus Levybacteria bacterium RIFCSPHIGHO2_01_FULL_37_17]OGH36677.1 MAG: cell division protein FtsW [Candidatus Levybacteria bacterium RIFCSPLOWO2_01_FULL_38_23]